MAFYYKTLSRIVRNDALISRLGHHLILIYQLKLIWLLTTFYQQAW